MPYIRCPECMGETHVAQYDYDGSIQCSKCAQSLQVKVTGNITVEVSVNGASGPSIQGLPKNVEGIYNETRKCIAAKCFTATELLCRKILMHVAVEKGAKEGETFTYYLSFLQIQGYVAKQMLRWLDLIRQHGNQATHEIATPDATRAESTLMFTVELLRLIYEMEFLAAKFSSPS